MWDHLVMCSNILEGLKNASKDITNSLKVVKTVFLVQWIDEHNVNNIFVMICGKTTPKQKEAIMAKTAVDIQLFRDLCMWFVYTSVCQEFKDDPTPNDVQALMPTPIQYQKIMPPQKKLTPH